MSTTIDQAARDALRHFVTRVRRDGITYVALVYDAPEWVRQLVKEAHGDMLPDDHRYAMVEGALHALADAGPDADPDDTITEWSVEATPTFTADLLQWLGSSIARIGYANEALEQMGADTGGITNVIAYGWSAEAGEVGHLVAAALRERVEA